MSSSRQRIAITGASGLIGGALSRVLAARGDDVIRLVRHQPTNPQQRQWDPQQRSLPVEAVVDVDAIVHLAGAGVGLGFVVFFFNEFSGALAGADIIPLFAASWAPPLVALLSGLALLCYTEDG